MEMMMMRKPPTPKPAARGTTLGGGAVNEAVVENFGQLKSGISHVQFAFAGKRMQFWKAKTNQRGGAQQNPLTRQLAPKPLHKRQSLDQVQM
jgi:hypothetical protein